MRFEYDTDPTLANPRIIDLAVVDPTIPAKVEIDGLSEATLYFYCARLAGSEPVSCGHFRTPAGAARHGLRFGVSGDWRGELGPFVSVRNASERDLDLFVALGDTIYADDPSIDFPGPQARTVEEFRIKHNEVYSERYGLNGLARLRESTAILAMIDDHEVTNDFAGGAEPSSDPRFDEAGEFINETQLYAAGLQAFHEYNPVREEFYGDTGDGRTSGKGKLYRVRTYGQDAAFFLLDARSFRDQELPAMFAPPNRREFQAYVQDSFDPTRTMLGRVQLDDLKRDLLAVDEVGVTWKFILVPEPIQNLGPLLAGDRFEGYAHERTELLAFIDENEIENVAFVSADIHGTIVNDLSYQQGPKGRQIATRAFEITTGSVAYAAPLAPTAMTVAPSWLQEAYDSLDPVGQNRLVKRIANLLLDLYGYPRIGLERGQVDAELLEGDYVAANTYGWTEFEIDATTQCLTVTTYGIDWYTPEEAAADWESISTREPRVVSRFRVRPRAARSNEEVALPTCAGSSRTCGALDGVTLLALPLGLFGCLLPARDRVDPVSTGQGKEDR